MSRKTPGSPRVESGSEAAQLRTRLAEAEQTLQAIRNGEVDAFIVRRPKGDRVFALQGADTPYRFLIEEMSEGALLLGPEGTVIYANAQLARWIGMPPGQIVGSTWDQFFASGVHAPLQALLPAARAGPVRTDLQLLSEHGALRPVGVSLCWLERQQIQGFSVVVTDQTATKQTEEQLKKLLATAERREKQCRAFFQTPAVGAAELGLDGRFLELNERLCHITGYSREELLQLGPADLTHPEDRQREDPALSAHLAGKSPTYHAEKRYIRKDREVVWVEVSAAMVRDVAGKPLHSAGVVKDITARRQAEEALRQSEELLRAVTDNSADAIYLKDRHSRWLVANPALLKVVGKPLHEVLGRTDVDIYDDPAIGAAILANDARIMERAAPETFEERAQTPEGVRLFLSTKAPWRDAQGQVIGLVGISRDITERKRAEEAMHETEQRFRLLAEHSPDYIALHDLQLRHLYVNPTIARIVGKPQEAFVGRSIREMGLPPEAGGRIERMLGQTLHMNTDYQGEISFPSPDGPRHFLWRSVPLRGADGKVHSILAISTDLTERKRAEEGLRHNEEQLRMALGAGNMGTWFLDVATGTVSTDPMHRRLWDIPGDDAQVPTEVLLSRVPPEDATDVFRADQLAEISGPSELEFRVRWRNGEVHWLRGAATPLYDAAGRVTRIVGVNFDVTAQKQGEAALARSNEELQALVAQRTVQLERTNRDLRREIQHRKLLEEKLLAAVDQERQQLGRELHDGLCQLLTGVKFKISLLEHKLARQSPIEPSEARDLEQEVNRSIEQARAMAHGFNPIKLLAQGLVSALLELASTVQATSQIRCVCECPSSVAIADQTMALHLYRIAQEAVQNAVIHGKALNIFIRLETLEDCLTLSVLDDGVGFSIPPNSSGGMGLTNMKARASLLSGSLDIQPRPQGGTAVTCAFRLPLAQLTTI